MTDERLEPRLTGVSETLLWTLWQRAVEARRPDPLLVDPLAIRLVDRLDYPFAERFGESFGRLQALRTRCFDREVRRFLRRHPGGTVVALGEGLETQFWRVDDGAVRWVGVDLSEVVELRRRLLPAAERVTSRAESALDLGWLEELGGGPALVSAQGLLMYLRRAEVDKLVVGLAEALDGDFVFDAMPPLLVERSRAGKLSRPGGFDPPPWTWALDDAEARRLAALAPRIREIRTLPLPRGRGPTFGLLLPLLERVPSMRRRFLSVNRMTIGGWGAAREPAEVPAARRAGGRKGGG